MAKSKKKILSKVKPTILADEAAAGDENNVDPDAVHAPALTQPQLDDGKKKKRAPGEGAQEAQPARSVEPVRDPTLGLNEPLRYVVSAPGVIEKAEGLYELLREARPDLENHIEDAVAALDKLERAAMGDSYEGHEGEENSGQEGPQGEPEKKFESGARVNVDMEDGQYKGVVDAVMPDGSYRVRTDDGLTLTPVPGYAMTEQTDANNEHLALPVAAAVVETTMTRKEKLDAAKKKIAVVAQPEKGEENKGCGKTCHGGKTCGSKAFPGDFRAHEGKLYCPECESKQGLQAGIIAASKKLVAEQLGDGSMVDGYLATMLWVELDGEEPLDRNYGLVDISEAAKKKAIADCASFEEKAKAAGIDLSQYEADTVGHDFWLTRNDHGAGFWDGDYEKEIGDKLTEISESFREQYPEVGDDGKVHFLGEASETTTGEAKESPAADVKASVFDEVEEIEIGEGYVVKKLREKGKSRILVVKDGEDGDTYPDAFGDDKKAVIDFFKQLLGVKDKKKDAKDDKGEKKDKPKKSETKLEDKPRELPFVEKKKPAKTDDKPVDEGAAKASELFSNRLGVIQQILMARKQLGYLEVKQEKIDEILLAGKGKVSLSAAMDAAMTAVVEGEQLALMRLSDAGLRVAAEAVKNLRPKTRKQVVQASAETLDLMNLGLNAPRSSAQMSAALSSAGIAAFGL